MQDLLQAPAPPLPAQTRLGTPTPWVVAGAAGAYILLGSLVEAVQLPLGLLWSQAFLFIAPLLLILRRHGFRPLSFLRADRLPSRPLLVLGTSASAFLCASGMMGLLQALLPEKWVKAFDLTDVLSSQTGLWSALLYFAVVVGAPLAEETVFRGTLLPLLGERLPMRWAVIWQAFFFSLIHADPVGFVPRFVLGLAFGILWLKTGSLWSSIFAHALNNGISSVLFLWLSGDAASEGSVTDLWYGGVVMLCGAAGLLLCLWRLAAMPTPPLPSRDPQTWALPWSSADLGRWLRRGLYATLLGLALVLAAWRYGR